MLHPSLNLNPLFVYFKRYGEKGKTISCPGDHVAVGSCGSGIDAACNNHQIEITCCPLKNFKLKTGEYNIILYDKSIELIGN